MDLDFEKLELIIDSCEFHALIGKCESHFFDCKARRYILSEYDQKYELAKDVSSFANTNGGFIIIGLKTKRSKTHHCDQIRKIRPFEQRFCNPSQYLDVIQHWIYPKLNNVEAKWYQTDERTDKGIFIIKIPQQKKDQKPFLITNKPKKSRGIGGILFGYYERRQDINDPKRVEELQLLLRDGISFSENLESRFQAIEASQQKILEIVAPLKKEEVMLMQREEIDRRIMLALDDIGLIQKRAMILSAYPDSVVQLRTIFTSNQHSIKHKLEYPPTIRRSGFDLRTLERASIIRGKFCRVSNGDRKVIDLYEDGVLIAGFKADEDFLCWAMKGLKINPVALVESIYTFVLFYEQVKQDMDRQPRSFNFQVDLYNFHLDNNRNYLVPYGLDTIAQMFDDDRKTAPKNDWKENIEINTSDFKVPGVAYKIVRKIYLYFGLEESKIPYTKEVEGERIVDVEQLKAM